MTGPVGCLIRPMGLKDRITRNTPEKWLSKLGLTAQECAEAPITNDTLYSPDTITVCSYEAREIWLGAGLFTVFNALCQLDDLGKLGTGVVLIADDNAGYYGVQEFYGGVAGWGGQVIVDPPRTWTRPITDAALKLPDSNREKTFLALGGNIQADPSLIERCVTGMNGKGRYGIAWHGGKTAWVLARIGADGAGQFQELDPQTYSKVGLPFDAAAHPDGWPSYWKQEHLFSAAQDHLARSWGGVAISEIAAHHPMFAGDHRHLTISAPAA